MRVYNPDNAIRVPAAVTNHNNASSGFLCWYDVFRDTLRCAPLVLSTPSSFPLSPPPFSKSYQPIFKSNNSVCKQLNFNSKKLISYLLPDEGFVFFQLDTLTNQGFTLFNFQEGYPNLINANQLIPPLRYLTTKEEFASLVSSSDSKLAVDQYWLSKASSKERARNLIRIYYSRVEFANKLFC